jgi:hypothetical protein
MMREKTQISEIRNAKIRENNKPWKSRKLSETTLRTYIEINFEEMDRFLDPSNHPKLNQEDINHLN